MNDSPRAAQLWLVSQIGPSRIQFCLLLDSVASWDTAPEDTWGNGGPPWLLLYIPAIDFHCQL